MKPLADPRLTLFLLQPVWSAVLALGQPANSKDVGNEPEPWDMQLGAMVRRAGVLLEAMASRVAMFAYDKQRLMDPRRTRPN